MNSDKVSPLDRVRAHHAAILEIRMPDLAISEIELAIFHIDRYLRKSANLPLSIKQKAQVARSSLRGILKADLK
jgi:hypothetical protein